MAVAVDAVGTETHTGAGTSVNYTGITIGAGSNRALVLFISFGYATTPPSGVTATWDNGGTNQSMTQIISADYSGGSDSNYLFGLIAPTSGNKTLALSWTHSAETFVAGISFTGVDQTGGATSFPHSATVDNNSQNITSAAGNYVVGGGSYSSGAQEPTLDTQIFADHTSGAFINSAAMYSAGAATVAIGMTNVSSAIQANIGTDILAAASTPLLMTGASCL